MLNIDQNQLSLRDVNGQAVPSEGAKAIPLPLDFSQTTQYNLDLQNFEARGFIGSVQSIFVDNKDNASPLDVIVPNTNQTIRVKPGWQGYFSLLCPNPAKLSFSSQGGVLAQVQLLNYPVSQSAWPTS